MDEERRIRFLIPPLFFVGSLLLGVACDPDTSLQGLLGLDLDNVGGMLGLLAGGGVVVVTFGFLLGTSTLFILRIGFRIFGRYHEVVLSADALTRVWNYLRVPNDQRNARNELFAGAAFDHEVLRQNKEGIHLWLVRRWNAFNVAATSSTAFLVSVVVGWVVGISMTSKWILPIVLITALFVWSAVIAWRDTMSMAEFQARRLDGKMD